MDKVCYNYNLRVEDLKMWLGFGAAKETIQQNEKTTYWMHKIICKLYDQQGINIQNI